MVLRAFQAANYNQAVIAPCRKCHMYVQVKCMTEIHRWHRSNVFLVLPYVRA